MSILFAVPSMAGMGRVQIPKQLTPYKYGNIVLDYNASKSGMEPVIFSHWSHRTQYKCRVCHSELGFPMKRGATEISEGDLENGLFCGACHNGEIAFVARAEGSDCKRCHGETALPKKEKFSKLKAELPSAGFGNGIDWTKALLEGRIAPKGSLLKEYKAFDFDKELIMNPPNQTVPPVRFPHNIHTDLIDCDSCHPDIFNVKLKGTQRFSMKESVKGRFCGVCHLRVAFPFDDCTRCHVNVWPE